MLRYVHSGLENFRAVIDAVNDTHIFKFVCCNRQCQGAQAGDRREQLRRGAGDEVTVFRCCSCATMREHRASPCIHTRPCSLCSLSLSLSRARSLSPLCVFRGVHVCVCARAHLGDRLYAPFMCSSARQDVSKVEGVRTKPWPDESTVNPRWRHGDARPFTRNAATRTGIAPGPPVQHGHRGLVGDGEIRTAVKRPRGATPGPRGQVRASWMCYSVASCSYHGSNHESCVGRGNVRLAQSLGPLCVPSHRTRTRTRTRTRRTKCRKPEGWCVCTGCSQGLSPCLSAVRRSLPCLAFIPRYAALLPDKHWYVVKEK